MSENTFLSVLKECRFFDVKMEVLQKGVTIADLCTEHSQVFASKGELRRLIQGGGFSMNKAKVDNPELVVNQESLLNKKYLLLQKGRKTIPLSG